MPADESHDDHTQSFIVLTKGIEIGHYRIIEKIGAGGMGEVYLAEDIQLNRKVALKFLPPHLCQDEDCRTRFKREAQAAAVLNHPNIMTIYEVGDYQGRPFIVMEHIDGRSLKEYLIEKDLSIEQILELGVQICEGLNEAHEKGVTHRDIKPSNILIDSHGRVKIVDFGLASVIGTRQLTKTGSTLGTIGYMSPEQVHGKEVDHRSDLFSLGVVLYELVTKQNPFKRDSDVATMKAVNDEIPEPIARFKSGFPDGLQQLIEKALEKDVKIRYQHADGMLSDLTRLRRSFESSQSTISKISPTPQSSRAWWFAGITVVALTAVALILWRPWNQIPATDTIPMIAVLPFDNLGLPEDDYFADGMTEEITSRLAGIQGLGVISRTSANKFKSTNKQLSEIGKELGVAYILEGTVRWSKDEEHSRVRITPQLVRVSDDRHLWADNYERELMQIFAIQADIAEQIVEQLGLTLLDEDKTTLADIPTKNAEAYHLYLRALSTFRRNKNSPDARKQIDSVVVLDPTFALAFALRSEIYSYDAYGKSSSEDGRIALESAKKSLELQPGLPQGYLALGNYYHYVETDYDRAMEQFSLVESRFKNNPDLFDDISLVHLRRGNIDQAVNYRRKALDLDPLNARRHNDLNEWLLYAHRYSEAVEASNRAIALEPDEPLHYRGKINVLESWYGEVDSIMPVANEALKNCDTMEFAKFSWRKGQYLPILPWDSLAAEHAKVILQKDPNNYRQVYIMYYGLGNHEMTVAYADSAKGQYMGLLEESPEYAGWHTYSGLCLSFLGECDTAIVLGLQGKELMSSDECFW